MREEVGHRNAIASKSFQKVKRDIITFRCHKSAHITIFITYLSIITPATVDNLTTGCSLNMYCFFPTNFQYFAISPSPALSCYLLSANKSDLRSEESLSYMQGMGCSELGKNKIFNEYPVATSEDN